MESAVDAHSSAANERNFYLEDIPLADAQERLAQALTELGMDSPLPAEPVPLRKAAGRITAEAVWARRSSPHYHASAMDGYAVDAKQTIGATETSPVTLTHEQVTAVNTGDPMPASANAVIMIEHVQPVDTGLQIIDPVAPWQHVRLMGEDIITSELLLPAGHVIRPVDLGVLAGGGHGQVDVVRKPQVVIIPTGSELVQAHVEPEPGQITEYNSLVLAAQMEAVGAEAHVLDIYPDDPIQLNDALDEAASYNPDVVLMLSGSSAGSRDFTASLIQKRGQLLVHGIAVRPGHPVIIGVFNDAPIFGVPGYPVSAALTGEILIQPVVQRLAGLPEESIHRPDVQAELTQKVNSPPGDDDFVRVTLAQVGDRLLATPLGRGAGVITSLVRADGLAHVPRFTEGFEQGQNVSVLLYRTMEDIQQAVLAIGSHDPMLDLLADYLSRQYPGHRLTSANVGSMGGLVALKRGVAHLAGMHLLDEATGEYNLPYIKKRLPYVPVLVATFAEREQGLFVAAGNPLNIQSIADLTKVTFMNRQRGSGTRLLLDYELTQQGISADMITGYKDEAYTHLAVAAAVAAGRVDCGMGVRSAALALGLDFVPVGWERFDLVIPEQHTDHQSIYHLLATLNSTDFKQALAQQPGYRIDLTGVVQHSDS